MNEAAFVRHRTVLRTAGHAIMDLSRDPDHRTLSRRLVADRAGLAHRDVCAHFPSMEAMIAETCLDTLRRSPLEVEIDDEICRRVSAALGSGAWPELVSTLHMTLLGAVVQAATCNASLIALSQQLGDLVDMLLPAGDAR